MISGGVPGRHAHHGVDPARVDRVDPHAAVTELERRDLGHAAHAELAGRVGDRAVLPGDAGGRGDVDDGALAPLDHPGRHDLHAEKCADQVDADHALELRLGGFRQRLEEQHPGVVDQNVHAAELAHGIGGHRFPACLVRDVVVAKERRAADRARQRLALAVEHVGDHHPGALGCEQPRGRLTHAARAARDDRHLAGQSSHLHLLRLIITG